MVRDWSLSEAGRLVMNEHRGREMEGERYGWMEEKMERTLYIFQLPIKLGAKMILER